MKPIQLRSTFIWLFLLYIGISHVQAGEIHDAAKDGKFEVVMRLLEQKRDLVDEPDTKYGATPLYWACLKGRTAIVELLMQFGAQVDSRDSDGDTPLHGAARSGNRKIVALLIDKRANVNAMSDDGETPLHKAATLDVAKLLIKSGADINAKINTSPHRREGAYIILGVDWTPLQHAAWEGRKDVVALLLENGATMNPKTRDGRSPLYLAVQGNHKDVIELLLSKDADVNMRNNNGTCICT